MTTVELSITLQPSALTSALEIEFARCYQGAGTRCELVRWVSEFEADVFMIPRDCDAGEGFVDRWNVLKLAMTRALQERLGGERLC